MTTQPIRRLFSVRALDDGRTRVVASTPDVDRYGDIVSGPWKLENFNSNPVVPWGHNYSLPPVGKADEVGVVEGNLEATISWDDSEENPLGRTVAHQYREGFLRAVSVGFYSNTQTPRSALPEEDGRQAESGYLLTNNELLEISAVVIPANPHALAKGLVPGVEQLQQWTAEGFEGYLRETLLGLIREDPAVRGLLESLWLARQVGPKDPTLTDWFNGPT